MVMQVQSDAKQCNDQWPKRTAKTSLTQRVGVGIFVNAEKRISPTER